MNKFYYFLFLLITIQITAQDSLLKYTPEQLGYKSSMATRLTNKPLLWKVYFDAMMRRNPTDLLKCDTYYNLSWDIYRYTDYDLDFAMKMMKQAVYFARKSHDTQTLIYAYDSLAEFYTIKNDNYNVLKCLEEIKKLHNRQFLDELSYLKFNESRIYRHIGDFERATSILITSNKEINEYVLRNSQLSKEVRTELIYIQKVNYIKLVQCYNYRKKLDSSAFYVKKIREIEKQGYPWHNNFDWIEEAFFLVLSKKYDAAIKYIAESKNKGFIDNKEKRCRSNYYLAICWEQKKNYTKSLELCEQALNIHAKLSSFINYDLELYKLAASNAAKIGDNKKEIHYLKKYNEISQKLDYAEKSKFIAQLYEQDVASVSEKLESEKIKTYLSEFVLVVLLFICLLYMIAPYVKSKNIRKKIENTSLVFGNQKMDNILYKTEYLSEIELQVTPLQDIDRKSIKISMDVDQKIVKLLESFEKKERFLSPNISLANMASEFSTNPAYVSAVIKKNKNTNFSSYINDLRIEYIIVKLKTSPEYLTYKIAYLAEECGFSSHNAFIRIFTEKTGLTPSKFISFLKTENDNLQTQNKQNITC